MSTIKYCSKDIENIYNILLNMDKRIQNLEKYINQIPNGTFVKVYNNCKWIEGKIRKVNSNGTYDIIYNDGTIDKNIIRNKIAVIPNKY